ncbi:MAG: bifunctional 1-(5-phosphoribosyl)-5-((5-phosphoribosylamino)methylideneamino)imidazole-4-carboxamide isomerase/phosphoribosylanthranilate isomerase PriA [Propionibacteriaceae bacterium]|jgi:1-(5-phosphoribosyl)-5-[(5-phosphoribosylamino)methylideneamino] imidazole-4-carboxamide isomerase/N-(5'phosphoribosyl)anthranilate isomerase|nr:bifunctional 1-(5-phosphoribosyl)-5-((5-phosphoribosylamino)methylideneamino)imidazole-4-carboxamide isomerase/phosphoribosylanthranilate isomerase PriA [Propionibacteriaceae bacterium]
MAAPLILLPAVDIRHGQAVQLVRGVAGSERVFGDPVQAALRWRHEGAEWLHLVNLDGAFGDADSWELVRQVVAAIAPTGMNVELSGGIRDNNTLAAALDTGVARVNIGTAAIENPAWTEQVIAQYGERIALAIDVAHGRVTGRGWVSPGPNALDTVRRFTAAGCARFVVTDVASDGTLVGPNLELLRSVCATTTASVVASGGIATIADIAAITELVSSGVEGAIIGTALYLGRIDLGAALALTKVKAAEHDQVAVAEQG